MSKEKPQSNSNASFWTSIIFLIAVFVIAAYLIMCEPKWFTSQRDNLRDEIARQYYTPQADTLPEDQKSDDIAACQKLDEFGVFVVKDTMTKLGNVVHLKAEHRRPEVFKEVAKLRYLNTINGAEIGMTDDDCKYLEGMEYVRSLNLGNNPITSKGLVSLATMPLITGVYLQDTEISGDHLEVLAQNEEIKILDLSGTKLTDADMPKLAMIATAHWLLLKNLNLTDEGIMVLADMPELRHLTVMEGSQITPEGKAALIRVAKEKFPKKDLAVD